MGNNFQLYKTPIDYTPVGSSETSPYVDDNLKLYFNTKRHWRTNTTAESNVVMNFGSAKAVQCVILNDVNFTDVYIQGNATDSWGSPSFNQQFTVSRNRSNNRYQLTAILSGFNYQYMRIRIPSQSRTDGAGYYRIGTICVSNTLHELASNPSIGYSYNAPVAPPAVNDFPSGGSDKIIRGDRKLIRATFSFRRISKTILNDLLDFDSFVNETDLCIFYENRSDTSRGIICQKEGSLEISEEGGNIISTGAVAFCEVN